MREPTELGSDTDQLFQTQRQCTKSNKIKSQKEKSIWSSSTIARGVLIKSRREAAIPKYEKEKKGKKQPRTRLLKKSEIGSSWHRRCVKAARATRRKYFDYFVFFNIVDYVYVNCSLIRSGARRRALA
jgi:hypothetical protein